MRLSEGGGMAYKELKPAVVIEVSDGEVGFAEAEAAHIVGDDGHCAEVGKVRPPDINRSGKHVELRRLAHPRRAPHGAAQAAPAHALPSG